MGWLGRSCAGSWPRRHTAHQTQHHRLWVSVWITMCITSGDNSAPAVCRSFLAIQMQARILLAVAGHVTRRPLIHRPHYVYPRPRQYVPWGTTAVITSSLKTRCLEGVLYGHVCGAAATSTSDTVRWTSDCANESRHIDSRHSHVSATARHFIRKLQLQLQLWQRKRNGGIDRFTAGAGEGQRGVRTDDNHGKGKWARVDHGTGR